MVLLGSAIAATPAAPLRAGESTALQASPWASAAAEARILADRILQRESDDLLLDGERQRTLGRAIKQALSLVRRTYPAMAEISVRDANGPMTLVLGLEGALREAVVGTWADESTSAPPLTGHAPFDGLNAALGLWAMRPFPALDAVVLHVGERANVAAAIRAYRAIDGVAYVEPDALLGDGSDIEAAKVLGRWHFVFRRAWGDCPAGCINQELSFFTVADGRVERVEPATARAAETFATILADRGWP